MAGLSGFSYYKEITISTANVDADLPNFPVYVPIVDDADIGGECRADGYDIQFSNSDNSDTLYFERLPGFAVSDGEANGNFFVRVPTVAGASNTVIRCYYGKSSATDVSSPENTFQTADGWAAVWHLEENGHPFYDATGNNNDSTGATNPTRATGQVGYGQEFTAASGHHVHVADSASLDIGTSDLTISFWASLGSYSTDQFILSKHSGSSVGWYARVKSNKFRLAIEDGADIALAYSPTLSAGWRHYFGHIDRDSATGGALYADGSAGSAVDPTAVGTIANTTALEIGAYNDDSMGITGTIDEIRISTVLRSAAWGKFEYYNMQDGHAAGNELSWGSETGAVVDTVLTVADAAHVNASEAPALTQAHSLAVADSAHAHGAESPALAQAHSLAVEAAAHVQTAEAPALAQAHTLAVADGAHGHTAENVELASSGALTVSAGAHAHSAEEPALTQAHTLAVQDGAHAHAAEAPTLNVSSTLAVQDAAHVYSGEAPSLTQAHTLAVGDGAHAHAAESPALAQQHALAVADSAHAHTAEVPAPVVDYLLSVLDAAHVHTGENVALAQAHVLAPADSVHAHAADSVDIVTGTILLIVSDAAHVHSSEAVVLGSEPFGLRRARFSEERQLALEADAVPRGFIDDRSRSFEAD